MSEEESEKEFQRLTKLLVERGFASSCAYDTRQRTASFEWTADGLHLQRLLRRLFDLPHTRAADLTHEDVSSLIMVIMLTAPS